MQRSRYGNSSIARCAIEAYAPDGPREKSAWPVRYSILLAPNPRTPEPPNPRSPTGVSL
jgi:hypothetical protein